MIGVLNRRMNILGALMQHLQTPLYRNGYALILSTIMTSGLGFVYWILAARLYPTEVVGLNSAAISTLMFLSTIAQLNMNSALNRFIPNAGADTARFILVIYGITIAAAAAAGVIFILTIDLWAPKLTLFAADGHPDASLFFVLATILWVVFVLQDSVLVGLSQATWVPLENLFFAITKLFLLMALVDVFSLRAIFVSWTIPIIILLIPMNYLIFKRLIPWHLTASTEHEQIRITPRLVANYVTWDYIGLLARTSLYSFLPLMVLSRVGAEATAYLSLTMTFVYSLYLLSENMTSALTTEAAATPKQLGLLSYNAFSQSIAIVTPGVIFVLLFAPYLLTLVGEEYVSEASLLFRLLSLSAIPYSLIANYLAVCRVRQQTQRVFWVLSIIAFANLFLSYLFLERYGIAIVGVIWVSVDTLMASFLLVTQLRPLWRQYLTTGLLRSLVLVPLRLRWRWINRHHISFAFGLVPFVQDLLEKRSTGAIIWSKPKLLITESDTTVVLFKAESGITGAVLKVPRTEPGIISLKRQTKRMKMLRAQPQLTAWGSLIPEILTETERDGRYFTVEQMLCGIEARQLPRDPETTANFLKAAVLTIHDFHERTATTETVNDELLDQWVDQPIAQIRALFAQHSEVNYEDTLQRLTTEFHQSLLGKTVTTSWGHGDFFSGNLLVNPDGDQVTGIIDWEQADPNRIPLQDVVMLLLTTRMALQEAEMGTCVIQLLDPANWTAEEKALLELAKTGFTTDAFSIRQVVLLTWMHHIAANLKKAKYYSKHWLWVKNNIESVLLVV